MIGRQIRLWWKALCSPETRIARSAVAQRFQELHEGCRLSSLELVDINDGKLVFLVFYQPKRKTRPAPYFVYEYQTDSQKTTELSETEASPFRRRAYK